MREYKHKIEYVLFDVDGLMIDSERVYTEANGRILKRYGHEFTWEIKSSMMGKPERVGAAWLLNQFPDIPLSMDEFIAERRACQDTLWPTCHPLPGVRKLVEHLAKHKIPMAIATGSISRNYNLKAVHHPEIFDPFKNRAICGDDPRLKGCGKPRPDIFLLAAELLGRKVGEGDVSSLDAEGKEGRALIEERAHGLVLEDSTNGLEAGQRAGMKTIWVPDERLRALAPGKAYGADRVLESLEHFRPEEWGLPPYDS